MKCPRCGAEMKEVLKGGRKCWSCWRCGNELCEV
ncbi:MAG TPA: hypothetical protein ENG74_01140 [Thermoplasmatales archaeon]|nr:hypothetical protein [Thermoplasmatales archaeon]